MSVFVICACEKSIYTKTKELKCLPRQAAFFIAIDNLHKCNFWWFKISNHIWRAVEVHVVLDSYDLDFFYSSKMCQRGSKMSHLTLWNTSQTLKNWNFNRNKAVNQKKRGETLSKKSWSWWAVVEKKKKSNIPVVNLGRSVYFPTCLGRPTKIGRILENMFCRPHIPIHRVHHLTHWTKFKFQSYWTAVERHNKFFVTNFLYNNTE